LLQPAGTVVSRINFRDADRTAFRPSTASTPSLTAHRCSASPHC